MKIVYAIEDLQNVAAKILASINTKTLLLYGDMGAGKTTLIKSLLHCLGSKDDVSSPTFSIVNEYHLPDDKAYHFDFYRIDSIEEAYDFGVEEYLYSEHWIFIEWPDRIQSILPNDCVRIDISLLNDKERQIKLTIP